MAVAAFQTLLANADVCDQLKAADNLVDLSKELNSPEMIAHAQIFAQQPRNSVSPILLTQCILYQTNIFFAQPNSVSIPYCQEAPKNPELNGLFQCQYIGSKTNVFVGNVQVGAPGTIPRNKAKPLDPPGSCPAHPQGPIADGSQLSDIVSTPFA